MRLMTDEKRAQLTQAHAHLENAQLLVGAVHGAAPITNAADMRHRLNAITRQLEHAKDCVQDALR